jgi:Mitochondrial ribosomal protein subunit
MSRLNSPTAQLLRSSRVFSLPPPLPRPIADDKRGAWIRSSDSATSPYPTHQVISTPESSRARGDWGLKRPLPLKKTAFTTEAAIRLNAIDTFEQITDFDSAQDHAKSFRKLQELHLALQRPDRSHRSWTERKNFQQPSAFEPLLDHTTHGTSETVQKSKGSARNFTIAPRWKHRGPSIQEMNDAEFELFVKKEVRKRAAEFNKFLELQFSRQFIESMGAKALNSQNDTERIFYDWLGGMSDMDLRKYILQAFPEGLDGVVKTHLSNPQASGLDITPGDNRSITEISSGFQALMDQFAEQESSEGPSQTILDSALQAEIAFAPQLASYWREHYLRFRVQAASKDNYRCLIEQFLDMPVSIRQSHSLTASYDVEEKPMTTHPSAGLSYHRTALVLENHPVFGPIHRPRPHKARTLPMASVGRKFRNAMSDNMQWAIGLAGVAADSNGSLSLAGSGNTAIQLTEEPVKGWVYPKEAHINPEGRIVLKVEKADQPAVNIIEEKLFKEHLEWEANKLPKAEPLVLPFDQSKQLQTPLDANDDALSFSSSGIVQEELEQSAYPPKAPVTSDVNDKIRRAMERLDLGTSR